MIMFKDIRLKNCIVAVIGSCILAFGMYNIHSVSDITEGGTLGLTLLIQYMFDISPAVSGFVLNCLCYILGFRTFGKKFLVYSFVSAVAFSVFYRLFELFPPLWQDIYRYPLLASVSGAVFVGIGVGACVAVGGATCGDDALAMSLSKIMKINIRWVYLVTDLSVLGLSLVYIPFNRIIFSLITVVLSGQIIGYIQRLKFFEKFY